MAELSRESKNALLEALATLGLTLADCNTFFSKKRSKAELHYVKEAQKRFTLEGELEVDDVAAVSLSDHEDGAYVQAWVWVPEEDI